MTQKFMFVQIRFARISFFAHFAQIAFIFKIAFLIIAGLFNWINNFSFPEHNIIRNNSVMFIWYVVKNRIYLLIEMSQIFYLSWGFKKLSSNLISPSNLFSAIFVPFETKPKCMFLQWFLNFTIFFSKYLVRKTLLIW